MSSLPRVSLWLVLFACVSCTSRNQRVATAGPPQLPSPVTEPPAACDKPWTLGVIGGDGRIVVACSNDVQRQALDESSALARALAPGLDPARERVCACATKSHTPPFVDLVFTAKPEEGHVIVRANADEDANSETAGAFVACVGTIRASFAPIASGACPSGPATAIYPVRLELQP